MSNLVFPMPAPPQGSWAFPVKKTPSYKTLVQTPASNRGENRVSLTPNPIYMFEYDFSYLKGDFQTLGSAIANLMGFYQAVRGTSDDWLFLDPYDNGITAAGLTNGNFEQSSSLPPPGWGAAGGAVLSYDTTTPYDGTRSLVVASFGGNGAISTTLRATPGQTFSASCIAKFIGGGSTTSAAMVMAFRNSAGSVLTAPTQSTTSAGWTPLTVDAVAPAGTATVEVELILFGGSSNGQAEFDDVTLSIMTLGSQLIGVGNGSQTQFQIGRALAFGGFEMLQNVFPTALFVNGVQVPAGPQASGNQWYCGLENWLQYSQAFTQSVWGLANNGGVGNGVVVDNAVAAPDGTTTAATVTWPSTTVGGTYAEIHQFGIPAPAPGTTFTFSVWIQSNSGNPNGLIAIVDVFGQALALQNIVITPSWQRFTVTATAPSIVNGPIGVIIRDQNNAATQYRLWGAQLERWSSPTSYVATTNIAPVFPRGLATLTTAPAIGAQVTADFSYYYRCRFLEDEFSDLEEFMFQLWELKSTKFKSLIL